MNPIYDAASRNNVDYDMLKFVFSKNNRSKIKDYYCAPVNIEDQDCIAYLTCSLEHEGRKGFYFYYKNNNFIEFEYIKENIINNTIDQVIDQFDLVVFIERELVTILGTTEHLLKNNLIVLRTLLYTFKLTHIIVTFATNESTNASSNASSFYQCMMYAKFNFFPLVSNNTSNDVINDIKYTAWIRSDLFNKMLTMLLNTIYKPVGWPLKFMLVGKDIDEYIYDYILNFVGKTNYQIKAKDLGTENIGIPDTIYSEYDFYQSSFKYENMYYVNCMIAKDKICCEKITDSPIFNSKDLNYVNPREYIICKKDYQSVYSLNIGTIIPYNTYIVNLDSIFKLTNYSSEFLVSCYLTLMAPKEIKTETLLLSRAGNKIVTEDGKINLEIGFLALGVRTKYPKTKQICKNIFKCTNVKTYEEFEQFLIATLTKYNVMFKKNKDKVEIGIDGQVFKKLFKNIKFSTFTESDTKNLYIEVLGTNIRVIVSPLPEDCDPICPSYTYSCETVNDFDKCLVYNMFPIILNEELNDRYEKYITLITEFGKIQTLKIAFDFNSKDLSRFIKIYNDIGKNLVLLNNEYSLNKDCMNSIFERMGNNM
jgi:hypothetical protein